MSTYRVRLLSLSVLFLMSCAGQREPEPRSLPETRQETPQPGPQNSQPPAPIVPEEWKPALDQVRSDMQDQIEQSAGQNQQALNRASQSLADVTDAETFIAYVQLMESLDPAGRDRLMDEQREWLKRRQSAADGAVQSKGGSLATAEYNGAFRKITEERLAELKRRMTEQRNSAQNKEKRP